MSQFFQVSQQINIFNIVVTQVQIPQIPKHFQSLNSTQTIFIYII